MKPQEFESREMLRDAGHASAEELLAGRGAGRAPAALRIETLPEQALRRRAQAFAAAVSPAGARLSFLGAGTGDHYLPAAVEAVGGFPADDAEIEALGLRFARLIEELTGMAKALPQVLDFPEAVSFAARAVWEGRPGRAEICIAATLEPALADRLQGILERTGFTLRLIPAENGIVSISALHALVTDQTAAVWVASPNFQGSIEPMIVIGEIARRSGAMLVAMVQPLGLAVLRSPGEYGAHVCLGNLRPLGLSDRSTGEHYFAAVADPAASFFVARDGAGALRRVVAFLEHVGGRGLRHYALAAFKNAHFLQAAICQIAGFYPAHGSAFFNEFVIGTPVPAEELAAELEEQGILAGLPLSAVGGRPDHLLVSVGETRTLAEAEYFLRALKQLRDRRSGRALGVDF